MDTPIKLGGCKRCGKPLPLNWKGEYCKICKEAMLFDEVRDFIRDNNVTEQEVAEYFGLPKAKVRQWITEGRIEYLSTKHRLV